MHVGLFILLVLVHVPTVAHAAAVHDAAKEGDTAAIAAALDAGAGVDESDGNTTPLYLAVRGGHFAGAKLLMERGADVNARDLNGYSPVHHAAARGDNELILYLVSKGADVTVVSRRGQTTADMANGPVQRISPFPETVALLEKLGSKNNHRCMSC